jgi:GTP cyclohydrolase I
VTKTPVDDAPDAQPVSARIRARLKASKKRFHANDNISAFLEPGELEALLAEVEGKFKGVLDSLVIDTQSDHNTQETAKRVAKMYLTEVFRGRYAPAPPVTEFPNAEALNELMIVGPDHHPQRLQPPFLPDHGQAVGGTDAQRALQPDRPVEIFPPGRMGDVTAADPGGGHHPDGRPADGEGAPRRPGRGHGGDHFCMHWRGVKDNETMMINSVMRGSFLKDHNLRSEFLSLLKLRS